MSEFLWIVPRRVALTFSLSISSDKAVKKSFPRCRTLGHEKLPGEMDPSWETNTAKPGAVEEGIARNQCRPSLSRHSAGFLPSALGMSTNLESCH